MDILLQKSRILKRKIDDGDLIAYADDIIIRCNSQEEIKTIIHELEKMEKYDLILNKKKSQILAPKKVTKKW
jgi:hypothetical protein